MKHRALLYLAAGIAAALSFPAACSNDPEVTAGDGDSAQGGNAGSAGDGDLNVGDGDGDGDSGDGDNPPPQCDSIGSGCEDGDSCCSGYCDAGSEECSCGPVGRDCLVGEDCCSGQCNPITYQCVQLLGSCAQADTPCESGTECCTLSCIDGFCSDEACAPDAEDCDQDGECCSGKCDGGTCAKINQGTEFSCETAGNNCEDNNHCCSGLCGDDGSCAIGASYCIQRGDVCLSDAQCCQGVCNIADGDSSGYCATQETSGTRCGERLTSGEVCGGDCAECCSRTCAPFGSDGVFICQPATGCRPDGELCRTSADCCGGNPDSSIPGAGQAECLKVNPEDTVGRCKVGGCNPHGAICGSPDDGTAACDGSLSAPNGQKCCGKNALPADVNPCSADSLLVPRCDVLEGCVEPEGECATADDCCNGNACVQQSDGAFRCFDTTDGCVDSAGPCTANADCCVGSICILGPGEATGVCGNSDPPGGMGGNTGTGGTTSSGGTPNSCAEFGQDCSESSDCCGEDDGVVCDRGICRYIVVR